LKILQICSAKTFGGGERHLVDLANELAARGHHVHAAVRPQSPLLSELRLENITTLPLRNALDAASALQLARYVREHKIDVIHAHLARDYPLAAYAARRNANCRLVITRHVLFSLSRVHTFVLSQVARVIAVSSAVKLELDQLLPPDRVVVIPNGIDLGRFREDELSVRRAKFRNQFRYQHEEFLVGTVGDLTPLKGHDDFLRAAAVVNLQHPNVKFLIAGVDSSKSGAYEAALLALIKELNLSELVRIVGWAEDLPSFYAGLDVFVSASHSESFGLAIAEAMASAVPVVTTATAGAQEIIADSESAVLAPIENPAQLATAINSLIASGEERARLGRAGRERIATTFSLERMVDRTEVLYEEVCRSRAG
jgi:L-malate glycosyltransferase